MSAPSIAVLDAAEVRLVLRAIDDLACLALGVFPDQCDTAEVYERAAEAGRWADRLAARLADPALAAEHHQAARWRADRLELIASGAR